MLGRILIPAEFPSSFAPGVYVAFALLGLGLLLGVWTPITATITALLEGLVIFYGTANQSTHILLTALAISLALLGPGAWSLDARAFGRKRIDI